MQTDSQENLLSLEQAADDNGTCGQGGLIMHSLLLLLVEDMTVYLLQFNTAEMCCFV